MNARKAIALLASLLAAAGLGAAVLLLSWSQSLAEAQFQRRMAASDLGEGVARLDRALSRYFGALELLAAEAGGHFARGEEPNLAEFDQVAARLAEKRPALLSAQYAPNGVVAHVYPEAGNESQLGRDHRASRQGAAALDRVAATGEPLAGGPYPLRSGKNGLVMAASVAPLGESPDSPRDHFLFLVVDFDALLAEARFGDDQRYEWAVRGRKTIGVGFAPIHGDESVFSAEPETARIPMADAAWEVGLVPRGGWKRVAPFSRGATAAAACLWALAFVLLRRLGKQSDALRRAVDKATASLRASEARWRAMHDASPFGIFSSDTRGRCDYVNDAYLRITGRTFEEVRGHGWRDIVHPDDLERYRSFPRKLDAKGAVVDVEMRYMRPDGEAVLCRLVAGVVRDQGEFVGYVGMIEDVSDRRAAEEALRQSEARWRAMHDASPFGIFYSNAEGNCVYVNDAYEKIAGRPFAEVQGRGWRAAVHPDDLARYDSTPLDMSGEGPAIDAEVRYVRPSGEEALCRVVAGVVRDEGRFLGFVGTVEDVSEARRAQDSLRESEERWRAMSDASPLGIFFADARGNGRYANRAYQEISGQSEAESAGSGWRDAIHPEDLAALDAPRPAPKRPGLVFDGVHRYVHKDGRIVRGHVMTASIRIDGELKGYVGVVEDITERLAMEARLRRHALVFEAMSDGVVAYGEDGTIAFCNPAMALLAGCSVEELVGADVFAAVGAIGDGEAGNTRSELALRGPNGRERVASVRHFHLDAPDGRPLRVAICRDVTTEKRAERRLRASEAKHRGLLERLGDGVCVRGEDGLFALANPAADAMFGVGRGQLVGRPMAEFEIAGDAPLEEAVRAVGLALGDGGRLVAIRRADGARRVLSIHSSPYNPEGALGAAGTLDVLRDETDRIAAKSQLARELAFADALDKLGLSINSATNVREVLRAVCGLVVEHCGSPDASILYRSPETGELSESYSTVKAQREEGVVAHRHIRPGGGTAIILSTGQPLFAPDVEADPLLASGNLIRRYGVKAYAGVPVRASGEVVGVLYALDYAPRGYDDVFARRMNQIAQHAGVAIGNARLISLERDKNAELEEALAKLKASERERDQFYRFLVHDLNKPLATILGTAKRLAAAPELSEASLTKARRVETAATVVHEVSGQFLEYESIRRGEVALDARPTDLWEEARAALAIVAHKLEGKSALIGGVTLEAAEELPPLVAIVDPRYFRRIVLNLLDNALKYGDSALEVSGGLEGDRAAFYIWNDGPAIPEEDRRKLFQEFFRASTSRGREGHGLGLASAKRLAEQLSGTIEAFAPERGGTEFRLTFPAAG